MFHEGSSPAGERGLGQLLRLSQSPLRSGAHSRSRELLLCDSVISSPVGHRVKGHPPPLVEFGDVTSGGGFSHFPAGAHLASSATSTSDSSCCTSAVVGIAGDPARRPAT